MSTETSPEKRMRLRYAGTCRQCGVELPARAEAIWERATKTVRCVDCTLAEGLEEPVVDAGTPGASARREYERRRANDQQKVRDRHPRTAGLRLALGRERQSTKAWDTGASGEEQLGAVLNERASDHLRVLHDRRVPGSRANVDHVVVSPAGVWVIDPKRYVDKRPTLRIEGGILRPRVEKLMVGGRNQTKLVDGIVRQCDLVRGIVGAGIPVRGVLCFIDGDWPVIGGSFVINGIDVLWPRKLYPKLEEDGPLTATEVESLYEQLGRALLPA